MDDHYKKSLRVEKKLAKKQGFRKGLLVGIFIPILLFSVIVITLIFSKPFAEQKIAEFILSRAMSELFSSFPDAYFSYNREKVIDIFDSFTNAASKNKISSTEFNRIGKQFLASVTDKQLTYKELDRILAMMQKASQ